MEGVSILEIDRIERNDLLRLYGDAGWTNYTNDIIKPYKGVRNSLLTMGAFLGNELIGFIRVVGDGETIIYIQDLIVHSRFKRTGIGTKLVRMILEKYGHIRHKVLITDNSEESLGFYKSLGFKDVAEYGITAFIKI